VSTPLCFKWNIDMPVYEYKCEEGHVSTRLRSVENRAETTTCKKCDKPASFIVSTPNIALDGTDPGFPGAYDKWARVHENAGSKHS